jgi:hypothetical protein
MTVRYATGVVAMAVLSLVACGDDETKISRAGSDSRFK